MRKLILLLLLFPFAVSAQKSYTAKFDDYMNGQVNVNDFSGNVLVAQKGKIIYEKAFGLADRELNVKNNLKGKFQIGSLTKQFTAAAILQLAEAGKLKLTDTIGTYFPSFPKGDSVTIHMLLSHTSGIRNYTDMPEFWRIGATPVEKDSMIALIKRQPLDFSPGSKWKYSNSGYLLLGYIIEKASGQSYSDYVLNKVIKNAGLENTFVNRWDSILANRVKGYMKGENGWQNAMYISMEGPYSAGAIISTVEDLYKWNNALFENKIISPGSLTKMTTPYLQHYGYGLGIDTFQRHLNIGHSGGIPGFVSYLVRFPADNVVVVVLSNSSGNSPAIANALAATLFGIPVIAPYKHIEVKIDSAVLNQYIGKYLLASSDTLEIIKKDGKIYRHKLDGDIELKPESNTKLFYTDNSDRQIEFKINKSGKVVNAFFINGGMKEEMKQL
jgi:CubicO group peptidase (beta-lactamase class C family)